MKLLAMSFFLLFFTSCFKSVETGKAGGQLSQKLFDFGEIKWSKVFGSINNEAGSFLYIHKRSVYWTLKLAGPNVSTTLDNDDYTALGTNNTFLTKIDF